MRGLLRIHNTSKLFFFPQKQVCRAVVEDSLKKGEQSPEGEGLLAARTLLPEIINSLLLELSWGPLCTITSGMLATAEGEACFLSEGGGCDSSQGCSPSSSGSGEKPSGLVLLGTGC